MNDWVECETCKTIYEYDPVRKIAQCPYCQRPEQTSAKTAARKPERGSDPVPREAGERENDSGTGADQTDRERMPPDRRRRPA